MLPHQAIVGLPIAGVVDIGEGFWLKCDVDGKSRVGQCDLLQSFAVGRWPSAGWQHTAECERMNGADIGVGRESFAAAGAYGREVSFLGLDFGHIITQQ